MSDTPETDAAIKEQSEWKLPFVSTTMDGVTYDGPVASLCRRMERERDEAQATLTDIHRWIERNHPDGFIDSMTFHQNLERVADRWYDRLDIVERERDELIERNAKLRDIADRALMLGQSL
jgi:hypothetical protein